MISKFLNSGSQKWSTNPRNFLKISMINYFSLYFIENSTPGPGTYNPKNNINLDGIPLIPVVTISNSEADRPNNMDIDYMAITYQCSRT